MSNVARKLLPLFAAAVVLVAFSTTAVYAQKSFLSSDDAKEKDEPQKFLPDYDKLVKGKDADWVYFPDGALKGKSFLVKEFVNNGKGREAKEAASYGKEYMEQWLQKQGYDVVEKGPADYTVEGNVFNAWEPSGAARAWGGWAANPGVGMELLIKDKSGAVVAEIRDKSKGSTIHDAVENGLEDCAKDIAKGK